MEIYFGIGIIAFICFGLLIQRYINLELFANEFHRKLSEAQIKYIQELQIGGGK